MSRNYLLPAFAVLLVTSAIPAHAQQRQDPGVLYSTDFSSPEDWMKGKNDKGGSSRVKGGELLVRSSEASGAYMARIPETALRLPGNFVIEADVTWLGNEGKGYFHGYGFSLDHFCRILIFGNGERRFLGWNPSRNSWDIPVDWAGVAVPGIPTVKGVRTHLKLIRFRDRFALYADGLRVFSATYLPSGPLTGLSLMAEGAEEVAFDHVVVRALHRMPEEFLSYERKGISIAMDSLWLAAGTVGELAYYLKIPEKKGGLGAGITLPPSDEWLVAREFWIWPERSGRTLDAEIEAARETMRVNARNLVAQKESFNWQGEGSPADDAERRRRAEEEYRRFHQVEEEFRTDDGQTGRLLLYDYYELTDGGEFFICARKALLALPDGRGGSVTVRLEWKGRRKSYSGAPVYGDKSSIRDAVDDYLRTMLRRVKAGL